MGVVWQNTFLFVFSCFKALFLSLSLSLFYECNKTSSVYVLSAGKFVNSVLYFYCAYTCIYIYIYSRYDLTVEFSNRGLQLLILRSQSVQYLFT